MVLLRQLIFNFSQLSKCRIPPHTFPFTLQTLPVSEYQLQKKFSSSPVKLKDEELPSSLFKYEVYSEKTAPVILDVEEERQKITDEKHFWDEFEGISLERGKTGVIDVEELVELLRREKGKDVFVVKVPAEYNYADYKVIVTGRSQRHMLAMTTFIRKLYKRRLKSNTVPHLEGKKSRDWMAIDLGNIILHVFSAEGRESYDLETLWSVGKDYDTLTRKSQLVSDNPITDYAKILAELTPKT